ncbi:hypothetical protein ACFPM3_22940 [Streptomyces coeruleoprunus]|uniref:Helix-turn-helix domain-containing protein n=1 Tax=Streptomyces coeruleoprunus TaxID=285563 RepID=A0ABV9XLF2_9ACTN
MLRHAIAPARRYTKASHDVVRHRRLNSDAKILLLYVQGLPEGAADKPLSECAADLGIKGRAYQRAKEQLAACGYLFEWRSQNGRGRWTTDQLLANITLTREEAARLRDGVPPTAQEPTAGGPAGRMVGGSLPEDEDCKENELPHPPPEEPAAEVPEVPEVPEATEADAPEVVEAERALLSLRHIRTDLLLGVREARELAGVAAEWLRRGVSAGELCRVLTSGLPANGVRSAVGFLRHRLTEKLPAPSPPPGADGWTPVTGPKPLVVCEGPGSEHVFRPLGDETQCPACRTAAAAAAHSPTPPPAAATPWRQRVHQLSGGMGAS